MLQTLAAARKRGRKRASERVDLYDERRGVAQVLSEYRCILFLLCSDARDRRGYFQIFPQSTFSEALSTDTGERGVRVLLISGRFEKLFRADARKDMERGIFRESNRFEWRAAISSDHKGRAVKELSLRIPRFLYSVLPSSIRARCAGKFDSNLHLGRRFLSVSLESRSTSVDVFARSRPRFLFRLRLLLRRQERLSLPVEIG